jgi:dolichol-phosphate mannosyltransferase
MTFFLLPEKLQSLLNRFPITKFLKFCIVGGTGVIVNAGMLWLVTEVTGLDYRISSFAAIETAIISNFFLNYFWTFRERRTNQPHETFRTFLKFNFSSGLTAITINWGLLVLLTEVFGLYYQWSNLIGIIVGTLSNFLFSHFWTFKTKSSGVSL